LLAATSLATPFALQAEMPPTGLAPVSNTSAVVLAAIPADLGTTSFSTAGTAVAQAAVTVPLATAQPGDHVAETSAATHQLSAQQLPGRLYFEANRGQTDARVDYLSRGQGYTLFLTPTAATLAVAPPSGPGTALRMELIDSNPGASAMGLDLTEAKSHYFLGRDPSQWVTDVPNYEQVKYSGVYEGIDLVYYGTSAGQLEYDFRVAPGADPSVVGFRVEGADGIEITPEGDFVMHTAAGDFHQTGPILYQEASHGREAVDGSFVLRSDNTVGFQVGAYDPARELVIDPALLFSTFLGGAGDDGGRGIDLDAAGNVYVTGYTTSANFPTRGDGGDAVAIPFQAALAGQKDAFVTKLDPVGGLVYSTYLGGAGDDIGLGIAVDKNTGEAYVTGSTDSANFPCTPGAFQIVMAGDTDAFVTKVAANGIALVYSTYLGGAGFDEGNGIALDGGFAYVTGSTEGQGFPIRAGAAQAAHGGLLDAFVTKVNPVAGALLAYSTYLGGSQDDEGLGIAVRTGEAYVTGLTNSNNFPVAPAGAVLQGALAGPQDAFVTKVNAAGGGWVYSTFLGGPVNEAGHAIAVDAVGRAFVTGWTSSILFPTVGAAQGVFGGIMDAFVSELDPAGGALLYSTFLGGNSIDQGHGIALDSAATEVFVTGETASGNFPVFGTWPLWGQRLNGGVDAFVTAVFPFAGGGLHFSGFLGGANDDKGYGIAVLNDTSYHIVGETQSANFPTTAGVAQPVFGGGVSDAFVTKLA
jgi:hypothetical protein